LAAPHVLVVDDDDDQRDVLLALLHAEGLTATGCERAATALDLLVSGQEFDLIISDVVMPEMDGVEFASQVRNLQPGIPVVLVTGHDAAIENIIGRGAIALLKPYSAERLKHVLREHLGPV
jgi:DNA-binding NtrC family response regulator